MLCTAICGTKTIINSGATDVVNPDINVLVMSWGMNMRGLVRVELSVQIDDRMFEIQLVNHRGWAGPGNHYDVNELEITSYSARYYTDQFKNLFDENDLERLKMQSQSISLNIARLEKGEFDSLANIDSYKKVVARFRNLTAFL